MVQDLPLVFPVLLLLFLIFLVPVGVSSESSISSVPSVVPTQNLKFYTENLPPYNYLENGSVKGFTIDILNDISTRSGVNLSPDMIHILPWEEAYEAALTGPNTVIFSTARVPDRENQFKWVGPISIERYVLFAPNESAITINSSDDLKNFRIGAITGDASISQLLAKGVPEKSIVSVDSISDLISMSDNKTIDLWAYPEITGQYYIRQITGNYDSFTPVYPLEGVGIYYAFSTDVPDSTVHLYQNALDELKQQKNETGTSRYDEIISQYIPQSHIVVGQE